MCGRDGRQDLRAETVGADGRGQRRPGKIGVVELFGKRKDPNGKVVECEKTLWDNRTSPSLCEMIAKRMVEAVSEKKMKILAEDGVGVPPV